MAGNVSALLVNFDFTGGGNIDVHNAIFTGDDGYTTAFADEVQLVSVSFGAHGLMMILP